MTPACGCSQADGQEIASDPQTIGLLKKQVQECLTHVRTLNEKLRSGADKNSDEIKVGAVIGFFW